jgi:hypothetical protein
MLKRIIGILALACATGGGFAQNPAVEQVRSRTQAVTIEDTADLRMIAEDRGEVVELNAQPARAFKFRMGGSTAIEHHSNARLLGSGPVDDWASQSAVEAGFNMPLGEKFSFDLSLRADVARYFHLENISYWGPAATALFDYRPHTGWPRIFAGGQLYRYDLIDTGNKITDAGAAIAGLDHSWVLRGGRSALSTGYQFSRFWASPLSEDRASHTLFATYTHQLAAKLYAQASYIWQYTEFENQVRHDSRHVVGVGLIYAPTEKFALRLYVNFVRNESSNPLTDYEDFTPGLGGAFSFQF